ncbi:MAG TPA: AAA family ATPase [Candidatus Dormibacteraeota bacterium]|nr:AAA family ATPase [Candidatus Dormibacteraeota bacterium]
MVALTPKAFTVLRRLVEDSGQLVTKEELLRAGWAKTHVSDGVLKVSILEIRRALGDDPAAPRFIETVPRQGYRFIAPRTRPARIAAPAVPGVLVGRDGMLAQLEQRLERARAGERQLVFLSGEAGIGKTTVLDAFLARAAADPDLLIASGACLEHYGAAEAYLPVLEALGRLLREPGAERVMRLMETHAPTWLVQMPWLERTGDRESLRRELLGVTKERMLREMAEALEVLTATTPLVLVLEDLHWSDYSTLDLLAMLARRQGPARLLVVGSYRSVEVIVTGHPVRALIQEMRVRRQCEDMPVAFLREEDVAAYLARRFPANDFPPGLARAVHQRTDGNPLFMVCVVDELVILGVLTEEQGRWELTKPLDEIAGAVPESLRQLIEKQVDRLEPEAQRLLEVASVLGNEFSVPSVAVGLDADLAAVEARCEALARQGHLLAASRLFVRPDGRTVALYHFTHNLYPHALIERVTPGGRLRLHQRLAEWLERTWGEHAAVIAGPLALHFEEAGDHRRAIQHLQRAADTDVRRWAYQEAIARLTRAIALTDHLPEADADAVYPILLDQLGRVHRGLGDVPGTLQTFDSLAAWARDRGRIEWQAIAARYRASALAWVDPEGSRAAIAEGMALSERVDDPLLRARVQGFAAYFHWLFYGRRVADARRVEAALAVARAAGDRELLSQSHDWLTGLQHAHGDVRTAAQTATAGIEIAREVGDVYTSLSCHLGRARALQQLGDWGTALATISEGLHMAAQIGQRSWASILRSEEASLNAEAFAFDTAAAIAREELAQPSLPSTARHRALVELGGALLGLGQLDEAYAALTMPELVRAAEIAAITFPEQVRLRHGLARVWSARGDLERARREAESLQALVETADEPTPRALVAGLLADISLQEGSVAQADVHLRQAAEAIEGCEAPGLEWRIAAATARAYELQHRGADAEAARLRSAAIVTRLADSLPPTHPLRASFLGHSSVRAVLRPPGPVPRSRRRS